MIFVRKGSVFEGHKGTVISKIILLIPDEPIFAPLGNNIAPMENARLREVREDVASLQQ